MGKGEIMDILKLINEKEELYKEIYHEKENLAELQSQKICKKAPLWEMATCTVDAKKDWINKELSEILLKISKSENYINHLYNQIELINDKMEYCELEYDI